LSSEDENNSQEELGSSMMLRKFETGMLGGRGGKEVLKQSFPDTFDGKDAY
jgi:hypothetical protein